MSYLGLHDADGNPLLVLDDGSTDGPFLIEEVDLGSVGVRDDVDDDPAGDGTRDNTANTGAAAVSVALTAIGTEDRGPNAWLQDLRSLCHPAKRLYLHVQIDDWGDIPRRLLVRGAGSPRDLTDLTPDAQFQWKAPLGYLEDIDTSEVRITPVSATIPGLKAPVSAPVSAPAANVGGRPGFTVDGGAPAWWEADIYGPCTGAPKLEHSSGWKVQGKSALSIAAGHFVRLIPNGPTGPLALADGDPAQDLYGQIDWTVSDPRPLLPGDNTLTLSAGSGYSDGFMAIVRWRARWP